MEEGIHFEREKGLLRKKRQLGASRGGKILIRVDLGSARRVSRKIRASERKGAVLKKKKENSPIKKKKRDDRGTNRRGG